MQQADIRYTCDTLYYDTNRSPYAYVHTWVAIKAFKRRLVHSITVAIATSYVLLLKDFIVNVLKSKADLKVKFKSISILRIYIRMYSSVISPSHVTLYKQK